MNISINDLNLHDSVLLQTRIDRDQVIMELDYVESYETQRRSRKNLVFSGCSLFTFKINPGYASPESILQGTETPDARGRRILIETNTTAGIIEIVAASVELL